MAVALSRSDANRRGVFGQEKKENPEEALPLNQSKVKKICAVAKRESEIGRSLRKIRMVGIGM
jgi:hypothetical protein